MSTKSFACLLATLLAYSAHSLSSPLSDPSAARATNQQFGTSYGGGGGVGRFNMDDLAGQAGAWQTQYDMVLVERIQGKPKLDSGLFVPDEELPRLHLCQVMSVGPGREEENGSVASMPDIEVGSIIFAKNPWGIGPKDEETSDGKKLSFMRSQDIAAVITGGLVAE